MKKSTCKIFLGVGALILIYGFWNHVAPLIVIGIVPLIIAIAKWNSEEEHKEVKKAQLEALKRGRVSVDLKGKMRKLK